MDTIKFFIRYGMWRAACHAISSVFSLITALLGVEMLLLWFVLYFGTAFGSAAFQAAQYGGSIGDIVTHTWQIAIWQRGLWYPFHLLSELFDYLLAGGRHVFGR